MKKSAKYGSDQFIHLDGQDLYLDTKDDSNLIELSVDIKGKVLDFSLDDRGVIRIFTTDGYAIAVSLDSKENASISKFDFTFKNASIYRHQILAIIDGEFRAVLLDFKGNVIDEYTEITKKVHFCIFTSQLKAVADSSMIFVKRSGEKEWRHQKYRELLITHLINVNRQTEFAITTRQNTRIFRKYFQTVFRSWAENTVALLQCPSRRHFYAHLNADGWLRIGDNDGEYAIQENDVTGICWDMGMLWARSRDAKWRKLVLSFDDQLFDMRASMLAGLETPLAVHQQGNVVDVIETIIERPAMAEEVMQVLPPIAQKLRASTVINDALISLDTYISKSGAIEELIGQIDLALDEPSANKE